jgi:allophanate hydrolase subunit 2
MTAALRVLAPGVLTTLQDLGRPGYQQLWFGGWHGRALIAGDRLPLRRKSASEHTEVTLAGTISRCRGVCAQSPGRRWIISRTSKSRHSSRANISRFRSKADIDQAALGAPPGG